MFDYEKELSLLGEYMNIYIQLLPYCWWFGGNRIATKNELPKFSEFKETYQSERSMAIPNYREQVAIYDNKLANIYTHGMGNEKSERGIAYRYYNFWMGCKYYTSGNVNGQYNINENEVKQAVKTFRP